MKTVKNLVLAVLVLTTGLCYSAAGSSQHDTDFSRQRSEQLMREEKARFEAIQAERRWRAEEERFEQEQREKLRRQQEQMRAEKARYDALQEERRRQAEQDAQEKQTKAEQDERRERIRREEEKMQAERERFEALQAERRRKSAQAECESQHESSFDREVRRERQRREEEEMRAERARFEAIQAERRKQGASGGSRSEDGKNAKSHRRYGSSSSSSTYSQNGPGSSSQSSSDQTAKNCAFIRAAGRGDLKNVEYFLSQGADLGAKDESGSTALHVACKNDYPEVAKYLFLQGADCTVCNYKGDTPLQEAWSWSSRKIIELFTGFFVIHDAYDVLIPISKKAPGLLESAHPDRKIDWRQLMSSGHVAVLPEKIELIAREAACALGVENVYFFHTNKNTSFACERAFNKIGISSRCMANGHRGAYDLNGKPTNYQAVFFKQTLYHELCHIRGRHGAIAAQKRAKNNSFFALSQEMEAELGALYYLFKIDGAAQFTDYIEDKEHPSRADHHRYIAHLYRELLNNPSADFSIVTNLAAQYLEEKTSGRVVVQDLVAVIKLQLAGRSKRSFGIIGQWILC